MKLGCFQSNKGLRQIDFHSFVAVAELGYEAVDIPIDAPDAAAAVRNKGLHVHSGGPLFLPELSPIPHARKRSPARDGSRGQHGAAAGAYHHYLDRPRAGT